MSKPSKQPKRKSHTKSKASKRLQRHFLKGFLLHFWKTIVGLSVLLTLAISFYSFSSIISVEPTQTLNLNNPMATPFVVTNESLLPIHSVEILCGINKIQSSTTPAGAERINLRWAKPTIPILHRKEQDTFLSPPFFGDALGIDSGDIAIIVSYRPDFFFWRKNQSFRFVTGKDSLGVVHWYHKHN